MQVQAVAEHLISKAGEATVSSFNDEGFANNASNQIAPPVVTDGEMNSHLVANWVGT